MEVGTGEAAPALLWALGRCWGWGVLGSPGCSSPAEMGSKSASEGSPERGQRQTWLKELMGGAPGSQGPSPNDRRPSCVNRCAHTSPRAWTRALGCSLRGTDFGSGQGDGAVRLHGSHGVVSPPSPGDGAEAGWRSHQEGVGAGFKR